MRNIEQQNMKFQKVYALTSNENQCCQQHDRTTDKEIMKAGTHLEKYM